MRPAAGEVWLVDLDDKAVRVEVLAQSYLPNRKWIVFKTLERTSARPAGSLVALPPPGSVEKGAKQWKRKAERPAPPPPPRPTKPAGGRITLKKPGPPMRPLPPPTSYAVPEMKVTHMLPVPPRKRKPPRDRAAELRAQGIPITEPRTPAEQAAFAAEFPQHVAPMGAPLPPLPPPPAIAVDPDLAPPQTGEVWLVSEQGVTWPGEVVGFDPIAGPYGGLVELRVLHGDPPVAVGEVLTALRIQLVQRLR